MHIHEILDNDGNSTHIFFEDGVEAHYFILSDLSGIDSKHDKFSTNNHIRKRMLYTCRQNYINEMAASIADKLTSNELMFFTTYKDKDADLTGQDHD